jgi:transglutaminase-like putative cysteine protease
MPVLTIRHVTTYRYRQPVAFGEHRMMLRPRDSCDQKLLAASLDISPEPNSLRFVQDTFGNHLGIAQFSGRSERLQFKSTICLDHSPVDVASLEIEEYARTVPLAYSGDELPTLADCIERHHPDPENGVGCWARQFRPEHAGTVEFLTRLNAGIHRGLRYRRREDRGIQEPMETLRLGQGCCRDFAILMIEAVRSFGLAARFVSGYLAVPMDGPEETPTGSTHAWVQVYLPGAGWIDFDPTNGTVGKNDLITVAVVRDPRDALPLHGTFLGFPSDHLGMDVEVSVSQAPGSSFG